MLGSELSYSPSCGDCLCGGLDLVLVPETRRTDKVVESGSEEGSEEAFNKRSHSLDSSGHSQQSNVVVVKCPFIAGVGVEEKR